MAILEWVQADGYGELIERVNNGSTLLSSKQASMTGVCCATSHVYKPLVSSTSSQIAFSYSSWSRHLLCFEKQDKRLGRLAAQVGTREVAEATFTTDISLDSSTGNEAMVGNSVTTTPGITPSPGLPELGPSTDVVKSEFFMPSPPTSTDGLPEASSLPRIAPNQVSDFFTKVVDTSRSNFTGFQVTGEKFITEIKDKVTDSISNAEISAKQVYDDFNGSILNGIKESQDAILRKVTVDPARTGTSLVNSSLKEVVVLVKSGADSVLTTAGHVVSGAYNSIKTIAPSEVQAALEIAEKKCQALSTPISSALHQAGGFMESAQRAFGIDTENPIVPVIAVAGGSVFLGFLYVQLKYGGYSGDLPAETVIDLLRKEGNILLVDIRPQALKDKDGVPDLRRASRAKLASVDPLEVERQLRNILRNADDVENVLTATIIRNLKNVKRSTKVIVMDTNGTRSKSVARALKRAGIRRSYRLDGGFEAWIRSGLRSKAEGTQTPLSSLREDAEQLVDELKPTPLRVLSVLLGSAAFAYALYEWETTLQFIGLFAIVQAGYKKLDSYESVDDLKTDIRTLQKPFRVVYQGILQAVQPAEKLELATSPSTTAVQDRVLQAAAKHGPVPSEAIELEAEQNELNDDFA